MQDPLLDVRNLVVHLRLDKKRTVAAVDGISFALDVGETLGVVGESGCGKSMTAAAILGLLPQTASIAGGQILFSGEDLARKSHRELRAIRGQEIAMIFQDPTTSLNPVLRIGDQMAEALCAHTRMEKKTALAQCAQMLRDVGLPNPETRLREYPHQLSGGQRQRVMIAMALLSRPSILIADEPTSSLDVTIQAQILDLIHTAQEETKVAVILISHDMGVVAGNAHKVLVMYAGKGVEYGTAREIFTNPLHPYTRLLLSSLPRLDRDQDLLPTIEGTVPPLDAMPRGCRFCTRCPCRTERCDLMPPPVRTEGTHRYLCHYPPEDQREA